MFEHHTVEMKWIRTIAMRRSNAIDCGNCVRCNSDAYTLSAYENVLCPKWCTHTQSHRDTQRQMWRHTCMNSCTFNCEKLQNGNRVYCLTLAIDLEIGDSHTYTSTHRESERTIATTDGKWRLSNDKLVCFVCFFYFSAPFFWQIFVFVRSTIE